MKSEPAGEARLRPNDRIWVDLTEDADVLDFGDEPADIIDGLQRDQINNIANNGANNQQANAPTTLPQSGQPSGHPHPTRADLIVQSPQPTRKRCVSRVP